MKMKRWMTLALSGVLVAGTLGYGSAPVKADEAYSTDYAITIPATLNVQSAGWNDATIEVKLGSGDAFDTSKKLTVTAASANGWKLKSENNDEVGYNLATTGDTYNAQAEPASWEFAAGEITTGGTVKPMGIIVEDYSSKPAGTYQDTVTFTASVEDAVVIHTTLSVGDVIHLGEVLSISTKYFGGGQAILPSKSPFTLVRANVTSNPGFDTTVTEAEEGQYYVLKGSDGSYCVDIGTNETSKVEATPTSDGIIVNTLNANNQLYFTTHEPQ